MSNLPSNPDDHHNPDAQLSRDEGLNMKSVRGDTVTLATAALPEDQRDAIRWLYAWSQANGWGLKQLEAEVKLSATTLYRVFTGKYAAKLDNVVSTIVSYRKLAEARGSLGKPIFVETSIAKKIWKACDWALVSQSMVFIFGNRGLGKTLAFEEYQAAHNHGQTKYVRMPASSGVQGMMRELARACYVSKNTCFDNLRESVFKAIDHTNLVIIDELHQVTTSYLKGSAVKCLEVLRELHDRTKCGMVLSGTNRLKEEILLGANKEVLEQFTDRGVLQVQLPARIPRRDVLKIAAGFGLDAEPTGKAGDVIEALMAARSLRKFGKLLQVATRLAAKESRKITWEHFVRSHDTLARLAMDKEDAQ